MARRRKGTPVDGWIVIDKPAGVTSTGVVNRVRRLTGAAKVGHGGTLDPMATGVLPIAFGEATKVLPYVVDRTKAYRFTVRWGEARSTDDAEGAVTATSEKRPSEDAIEAILPAFTGWIDQAPPAYSAIKVAGQRAYKLARTDRPPDLPPRPVYVERLSLERPAREDSATFLVTCGKGAYMRALARDIAVALGTVGHVVELRRLRVGPFTLGTAIPLADETQIGHIAPLLDQVLAVETALDDIPALAMTESEATRLRRGQAVPVVRTRDRETIAQLEDGAILCALHEGRLIAMTRLDERQIRPVRVMNL